ncbi:MAG: heavy metal translocating P-type ATPase, partial [Myxococcales bacterium]|nr:heavy metal translocating P-type ATPase [Myxococcales bacterium]
MTTPCAHCGLPTTADPAGAPAFCCPGCRTVWELVHQAGLDDYYALRSKLGEDPRKKPGDAQALAAAEEPAYAHLDDPQVLAAISVTAEHPEAAAAELHLLGLHCAACVWLIERLPAVLEGVLAARVDYGAERLRVEWDPRQLRLSQIAAFLHRAGYQLHALDAAAEDARRVGRRRELVRMAVAGASAGNVMLVSFALHAGALSGIDAEYRRFFSLAAMILALPAVTWGALPFYRAAWAGLRARRLHIDLPIALGVAGGFIASTIAAVLTAIGGPSSATNPAAGLGVYFDSVSLLVFLLLIGRWVQRRGQSWALSQTDLLQLLLPVRARRRRADGSLEDCSAASLEPGERVSVRAGERLPIDGRVLAGRSSIDASSLTGESLPQSVEVGAAVWAGTRNVEAALEIEVEAVGAQTRIGSLAARIMEADRSRAPIQRTVDRVSSWFVAAVLTAA